MQTQDLVRHRLAQCGDDRIADRWSMRDLVVRQQRA